MLASFLCNGVIFGFINSYGTIYVALKTKYDMDGFNNSDTMASLLGSLLIGTTFLMSPISGVLVDRLGIRVTAFLGGFLATLGAFLSSFTIDNVSWYQNRIRSYLIVLILFNYYCPYSVNNISLVASIFLVSWALLYIQYYGWQWIIAGIYSFSGDSWSLFQKVSWSSKWVCYHRKCNIWGTFTSCSKNVISQSWSK